MENAVAARGITYSKFGVSSSPVSTINLPINVNENGTFDPAVDPSKYSNALDKLFGDKIYTFKGDGISVNISKDKASFLEGYKSTTLPGQDVDETKVMDRTLGISYTDSRGKSGLYLNDELLNSDAATSSFGGSPIEETIAHEIGHVVHRQISPDWEVDGSESSQDYKSIFDNEQINEYSSKSFAEHFGENFSRYLVTGEASDEFKDYLKKRANFSEIDPNDFPYSSLFTDELDAKVRGLEGQVNQLAGGQFQFKLSASRPSITVAQYAAEVARNPQAAARKSYNTRQVNVSVVDSQGRTLGNGHASIETGRDGGQVVNAEYLKLPEELQASGSGTAMFQGLAQMLGEGGGGKIKVLAALTNGPYTWALQGFDFQQDGSRRDYNDFTRQLGPVMQFFYEKNRIFKDSSLTSEEKLKMLENLNGPSGDSARIGDVNAPRANVTAILAEVSRQLEADGVAPEVISEMKQLARSNPNFGAFAAAYFLNNWNINDATFAEFTQLTNADYRQLQPRHYASIGRNTEDSPWTKPFKKSSAIGRFIMIMGASSWYGEQTVPDMSGGN